MLQQRRHTNSGKTNPLACLYQIGFSHVAEQILIEGTPNLCGTHFQSSDDKGPKSKYYKILQEYTYMFPDEVLGLLPKRYIDFTINLVPRASLVSKTPYKMSTPKFMELKI